MNSKLRIVVISNSVWNLNNFRRAVIIGFQRAGHEVILGAPTPDDDTVLEYPGIAFEPINSLSRSSRHPIRELKTIATIKAILIRRDADALFTFTAKPNLYGGLAARMTNTPFYPTLTGLGYAFIANGIDSAFVKRLYPISLKYARSIIFHNTDDLELFLFRDYVRPTQCRIVGGSGIDLQQFRFVPYQNQAKIFLFIGRLLTHKGIVEFVKAAAAISKVRSDITFMVVGEIDNGNPASVSQEQVDDWVSQKIITYTGKVRDVRPFIEAAYSVVLPSYREGVPRALLEAAAMGRLIIGTDVPGIRRIAIPRRTGFLVPKRSWQKLAHTILETIELPKAELNMYVGQARELVEKQFSRLIVAGQYLDILDSPE